jgi:hypothetical protein
MYFRKDKGSICAVQGTTSLFLLGLWGRSETVSYDFCHWLKAISNSVKIKYNYDYYILEQHYAFIFIIT